MSHWAFVIAAYAVTLFAVGGLLLFALRSMRSAEEEAGKLRDRG